MPEIIPWPCDLGVRDMEPFLRWTTRSAGRSLAGHEQIVGVNAGSWEVTLSHAYAITAAELRQFIEPFEQIEVEKTAPTARQKEVMAEATARGHATKVMKKVVALHKRNKDDLAEEEAILKMCNAAPGMV